MRPSKKIILLSDGLERSIEIECLLRVAGYAVTTLDDVEQAVNRCGPDRNTAEQFDLLIAEVESDKHQFLSASQREGNISRLLLIHNDLKCRDLYCVEDRIGHCFQHSATLACVQEMMNSTPGANKD